MGSTIKENCITTVQGIIQSSSLGFCHSHEHLFLSDGQSAKVHPALRLDDFDKTVEELNLYKEIGGISVVDAQPVGCGRIAKYQLEASNKTGINIIASTGFHKLIFYPEGHWIHSINEDALADIFINELSSGMYTNADYELPSQRISALPGVIKTASDINGVDSHYKRLFSATAEASTHTGTPIMSHTEMGKGALEQIKLFDDYAVPIDSIIICHLDRTVKDISYHLEVAQTGVYMEFDTIGRFKYHSDEDEAEFISKMVDRGYEDKILIGLDTTRERMKSYGGDLGLDYIKTTFIPLLKSYGLTDEIIKKFVINNPAKAFSKFSKKL
ncbi:MAG: phosphotriesterase family protein [Ruminiclostridium sp.]